MNRKQRYFTLSVALLLLCTGAPLYLLGHLDAGMLVTGGLLGGLGLWPTHAPRRQRLTAARGEHA